MAAAGDDRPLVLLTGATGFVGGLCRQHWGDRYRLRLADVRPMEEAVDTSRTPGAGDSQLAPHEEFVLLDIADYDQFARPARASTRSSTSPPPRAARELPTPPTAGSGATTRRTTRSRS